VASYRYDPFGNTLSQSGSLSDANVYRFSSKEIHSMTNSVLYYYGYRFYEPGFERWLNRDPLEELDDHNLYRFTRNDPISNLDVDGRFVPAPPPVLPILGTGTTTVVGGGVLPILGGTFGAVGGGLLLIGIINTPPDPVHYPPVLDPGPFPGNPIPISIICPLPPPPKPPKDKCDWTGKFIKGLGCQYLCVDSQTGQGYFKWAPPGKTGCRTRITNP
jgi:RHS repeat-associated protein